MFTSDEDLHPYRDHFSYIKDQPNELIPSAAVGPDTTEQVQAIVRTANKYKIPLYAISTGKNFAYGGPSPNVRGSVSVDLKRMNRMLEVRRRSATSRSSSPASRTSISIATSRSAAEACGSTRRTRAGAA